MNFEKPTLTGTIQNRYKRFFADILPDDGSNVITAHVPNTGSMKTCWAPGWKALLTCHENPKRKLPYTLEMVYNGKTWIGINTFRPNKMALLAIKEGVIKELRGYKKIQTEFTIGNSRIDLFLDDGPRKAPRCYVEIKNVTLAEKKIALFPDAITTRGQKHLKELIKIKEKGDRAVMLFVVQREDVHTFSCADAIDPIYGRLLRQAQTLGVELLAYQCSLSKKSIAIKQSLTINL